MQAVERSKNCLRKVKLLGFTNTKKIATNEKKIKLSRKPSELHKNTLGIKYAVVSQNLIGSFAIFLSGANLKSIYRENMEYRTDKSRIA